MIPICAKSTKIHLWLDPFQLNVNQVIAISLVAYLSSNQVQLIESVPKNVDLQITKIGRPVNAWTMNITRSEFMLEKLLYF